MEPLYIVGPTGSGKSSIAVELARQTGGEIVNADPFQLYRGLDILTAKPSATDQATVPHHLYGSGDPTTTMDAASFAKLATEVIRSIISRQTLPIVVSGSGLYVKALTHGLSPLPRANKQLRAALADVSSDKLIEWLHRLDPIGAGEMNLLNPRHVERSLEISLLSGRPASELKADWEKMEPAFDGVFIERERDDLYERINSRSHKMLEEGLIEEVAQTERLGNTAERAIGLQEIRRYLGGQCTLEEVIAALQQATRRYAKRQTTWFRREKGFQSICLERTTDAKSAVSQILTLFPHLTPQA